MEWDDISVPKSGGAVVGEPLASLSLAQLEERVTVLRAEIGRVEAEIATRRRQAEAAAALFTPKP